MRDVRSLIDKDSGVDATQKRMSDGGESMMTEESITSRTSTIIAGGGSARRFSQKDKTNGRNRVSSFADSPPDNSETIKMLSIFWETNNQQELTIQALQKRLEDMTNEWNALVAAGAGAV